MADGDGVFVGLALADDEHVGDAGEAGETDFRADLVGVAVHGDADAGLREAGGGGFGELQRFFRDGQDADLFGGEPGGELALEMLDEQAGEAFHGAERRAVDHHGNVRLVVGADIAEAEADRQIVVHLHGAELPFAADDVLDHEVDLGSVEGRLADLLGVVHAEGLDGFAEGCFGFVPVLGRADIFVAGRIAQREPDAVVIHAEGVEDFFDQIEAAGDFGGDLLRGAEQMGVVLGEAADAGHAAEFAGLLPAIDGAELRESHREIAIGMRVARIDPDVMRAIHRLEQVALVGAIGKAVDQGGAGGVLIGELFQDIALGDGGVLAFLIVGEMAGGAVEVELADVRREDLRVALLVEFLGDELLKRAADQRALRFPQDEALADHFVDVEQPQLAAEAAVVALFRLLQAGEVFFQQLLAFKGGAVEALELALRFIAQIEGRGDRHQLHVLAL